MSGVIEAVKRGDVERKCTCGGLKGNARVSGKITPVSPRCFLSLHVHTDSGCEGSKESNTSLCKESNQI